MVEGRDVRFWLFLLNNANMTQNFSKDTHIRPPKSRRYSSNWATKFMKLQQKNQINIHWLMDMGKGSMEEVSMYYLSSFHAIWDLGHGEWDGCDLPIYETTVFNVKFQCFVNLSSEPLLDTNIKKPTMSNETTNLALVPLHPGCVNKKEPVVKVFPLVLGRTNLANWWWNR